MGPAAQPASQDAQNLHFLFFPDLFPNPPPPGFNFYNYSSRQSAPGGSVNYARQSFRLAAAGNGSVLDPGAGVPEFLRFFVAPLNMAGGPTVGVSVPLGAQAQPWWVSRVAVVPMGKPLKIEVHAVMYAQTGRWFV